jgi:hypothetical protein
MNCRFAANFRPLAHGEPEPKGPARTVVGRNHAAFSLLEVMIALSIFFMAIFVILDSVSRSLGAARSLQQNFPDIGVLAADLALTNKLVEGTLEGDFGKIYPGYRWTREISLIGTNGFFQIDYTIHWFVRNRPLDSKTSLWLWRPESQVSTYGRHL